MYILGVPLERAEIKTKGDVFRRKTSLELSSYER